MLVILQYILAVLTWIRDPHFEHTVDPDLRVAMNKDPVLHHCLYALILYTVFKF